MIINIVFWITFLSILHTYLFYPSLLAILNHFKTRKEIVRPSGEYKFISVLMAIHNEEAVIEKKIRLIYNSDYPLNKFEVIVGSDNSDDNTNNILSDLSIEFKTLSVVEFKKREGKPSIINKLATYAKGEILIITDANVFPENNTIRLLTECFKDPMVGLADSKLVATGSQVDGISIQEKTYTQIEVKLKNLEGNLWGTMMGPSGGFYAVSKDLFEPVPVNFLVDDFYICMKTILKGKKAVSSMEAIVYEDAINDLEEEFQRKVRISVGDFQNLSFFKVILLNPFRLVSFSFLSHKVLRWISPFLFLLMLTSNSILLADSLFFFLLFILQFIFLFLPILDILLRKFKINLVALRFTTHFFIMNLALLTGFFKNLKGVRSGIWDPTKRH
jgi:cellulose synthase/poly-beta-1,6-N-acetylglucosamine synthase-like glycosyltransferase